MDVVFYQSTLYKDKIVTSPTREKKPKPKKKVEFNEISYEDIVKHIITLQIDDFWKQWSSDEPGGNGDLEFKLTI